MSILPFIPVVVGVALVFAPPLAKTNPVSKTTRVAKTTPGQPEVDHPHHTMGTKIGCVNGSVVFNWFTVPSNPEQMKKAIPNFTWSRGFTFNTTVPLESGGVTVKPGNYQLSFKLDAKGENWSVVLGPAPRRGGGFGGNAGNAGDESKVERFEIPMTTFKGEHAEHMEVLAINRGYKRKSFRDTTPVEGTKVDFRVSFGDLHTAWSFQEVFGEKKDGESIEEVKKD